MFAIMSDYGGGFLGFIDFFHFSLEFYLALMFLLLCWTGYYQFFLLHLIDYRVIILSLGGLVIHRIQYKRLWEQHQRNTDYCYQDEEDAYLPLLIPVTPKRWVRLNVKIKNFYFTNQSGFNVMLISVVIMLGAADES